MPDDSSDVQPAGSQPSTDGACADEASTEERADGERAAERPAGPATRAFAAFVASEERGDEPSSADLAPGQADAEREYRRRVSVYRSLQELEKDDPLSSEPQRFGRFEIVRRLTGGGTSRVYEARDPKVGRSVAVKILDRPVVDGRERALVLNEARSLGRLEHPGVVRVLDVSEADGWDYLLMEFLPGPSLSDVIAALQARRDGEPVRGREDVARIARRLESYAERVRLLARIARALAYCHDRGVVHRDVKVASVLFDAADEPRLIDFGIAHVEGADEESRAELTFRLVGTPDSVAPEQIEAGMTGADPKSDQFSFGVLAYQLLALEHPFRRDSRTRTLDAIALARPRSLRRLTPAVAPDLERVVLHALSREPKERYPDVTALADDLDLVLGHRPISVSEPTVLESLRLAYRRNTRAVWLVAGVLLLLVTAALASRWRELSSEHGRITKEVSRIEERIERLEGPDAVRAAAIELLPLLEAAERFDRRLGAGLFDPVRESTARTVVGLEGRLVELFARAKQDSARRGATFQRSSFRSAVEVLAASLQPLGRPLPSELADEGRVFLPPEVEGRDLFVFEQVESQEDVHSYLRAYRFFHPIGSNFPAYPESGAYCLLAYDDGVLVWERELSHDASKIGSRELRYGLRDPDRFRAARVVPAGSVDVWMPEVPDHPQTGPVAEVALAAFAVLPAPVSQRELCRFLVATGKSTDGFDPSSDEPADVSEPLAREYCEHVGGRLPLRIELHAACTEAWFEPSLLPQDAPEPQITWEWIADKLSGPTELFAVSQQYLRRAFRNGPGIQDISPSARFREPTYFRVVFTIATPEELLLSGVLSPR